MDTNPPPPNNPTPAGPPSAAPPPQVVVVKKRGCLGWIGLAAVGFVGLMVVVIIAAVATGGSGDDEDAQVQSVVSDSSSDNDADPPAEADSGQPDEAVEPTGPDGSRERPWPFGTEVNVTWDVFGDADGSVWTTSVGPVRDFTTEVVAANQFNEAPPEGAVFAAAPVSMTLVSADKEPLSAGFNLQVEIHSGPNVYDANTLDTLGCGSVPGDFDMFTEVFAGGTVEGEVCIPITASDLADARVALNFGGDRIYFGE